MWGERVCARLDVTLERAGHDLRREQRWCHLELVGVGLLWCGVAYVAG